MEEEGKSIATPKPIYAELNQMAEILLETRSRIDGLENIVNRIAQPEPSVAEKDKEELKKSLLWDDMTLEQKIRMLKQAVHNNYEKLIAVGNRLNSLV